MIKPLVENPSSPIDAGRTHFQDSLDFFQARCRGVAWCGHGQGAMGDAVIDGLQDRLLFHQTVNQVRGKTVATPDTSLRLYDGNKTSDQGGYG